jgi:hypothetical protein
MKARWLLGTLAVSLTACGQAAPKAVTTAAAISSVPIGGSWSWRRASTQPGTLRIEREHWNIAETPDGRIEGVMWRQNRFISTDGQPFECIQGLAYELRARYELRGQRSRGGFHIRETQVELVASPCESGTRPLQEYRGLFTKEGRLHLRWHGGEQELQPSDLVTQAGASAPWPFSEPTQLAGEWSWSSNATQGNLRRQEREEWIIEDTGAALFKAQYRRRVHIEDTTGHAFPCAGSDRYSYEDRYQLEGRRDGKTLQLQEQSVEAAEHPCLEPGRVLDAATARLYADALRLEWRGKRMQILRPTATR